jgi:hypothetical protein
MTGAEPSNLAAGGSFLNHELPENIQHGLFIEQCTKPAVVQSWSRRIVDTWNRNGREDSVEEGFMIHKLF